jgi:hypothetical protein
MTTTTNCIHPEEKRNYDYRRTDGFSCDKCGLWIRYDKKKEDVTMGTSATMKDKEKEDSELDLMIAQMSEKECLAREQLERKYCEGLDDGVKMSADEFFDRGYAAAIDDLTAKQYTEAFKDWIP